MKYGVEVRVKGSYTVEVDAPDEWEAEELAIEQCPPDYANLEVEVVYVERLDE